MFSKLFENKGSKAHLALRVGIAAVLFYFGINELLSPGFALAFMAPWSLKLISFAPELVVYLIGIIHVVTASLILVGYKTRAAAFVVALLLVGIIVNLASISAWAEVFRDIAILAAVLALFFEGAGKYSIDEKN